MKPLTKIYLILLTIVSFSIGLTYVFAALASDLNFIHCVIMSLSGFHISYLLNEELITHEPKKETDENETFYNL